MRPATPLLILLALSSSLLHPAASLCVPRGSTIHLLSSLASPPSATPPTSSLPPSPAPAPATTSTPPPPASKPSGTPHPANPTTQFPASISTGGLENLMKIFCSHTDYSDLCLKSVKEVAPTLTTANNDTVLSVLMKAVDAKTHEARAFAQKLSSDPSSGAKTGELLRDCIDSYDDALDNLEAAKEAILAHDDGTRDSMLSAMISNFGTCEDGFQEFTMKSPLAEWSHTLQNMTDNCLAVINMGKPQHDY